MVVSNPNQWLLGHRRNITSQFGEDGIIEKIFSLLPPANRWCVELGALNGTHHSNTRRLLADEGWSGVMLEADPVYFEKLRSLYAGNQHVYCVNEFVDFEGENTLDRILHRTPIPPGFDLFSLDIDGNDYHIWESLADYHPRVVIVEFNPSIPDGVDFVQPRDMRIQQGSSLDALSRLGKAKGYELIAATDMNAIFVRREFYPAFSIADNTPAVLRATRRYETKFFQLYDGTLMLDGCKELIWHKRKIDAESIQVLPPHMRRYPAGINPNPAVRWFKALVRRSKFYGIIKWMRSRLFHK